MELHFDCVFYYVSDLEAGIRFYRDVLGFRLVSQDVVARFAIDGVRFEIVPAAPASKPQGRGGNARLALRVVSVEKTLAELRAKGLRTAAPEDKGSGVLGRFEDPDGNEICLWEYR